MTIFGNLLALLCTRGMKLVFPAIRTRYKFVKFFQIKTFLIFRVTKSFIMEYIFRSCLLITETKFSKIFSIKKAYTRKIFASYQFTLLFHDGGRYHIETSPLFIMDWFLYDNGLRHERVKGSHL